MSSPPPAPDPEQPRASGRAASAPPGSRNPLARWAVWLAVVVLLAPAPGIPLGPGIDASFLWGIDALVAAGAAHGRDVAFTYGPLGYLLLPHPASGAFGAAMAFRWAMHALWAAALAVLLRRRAGAGAGEAALFALLTLLAAELGLTAEGYLLLTAATLLAAALWEPGPAGAVAAALAGALAPAFALLRLSLGAEALGMTAVFAGLCLAARERRRRGLVAVGAMALSAAVLVPLCFPSLGDAGRWLAAQGELARGFSAAMSKEGLPGELAAGVLCLAIFAALLLHGVRTGGPARALWWMLLPAVLLAFKHGFVRQDRHVLYFFASLLGLVALGLLAGGEEPRQARAPLVAALGMVVLIAPVALLRIPQRRPSLDLALGRRGWASVRALADLDGTARYLDARNRRLLRPSRLPRRFAREARRRDVTADVVPWELSIVAANGLRWRPSPTLQLYTAYTRELDAWSARHFAGPRAPDLLLAQASAVDGRNMLWDTPETWRAILTHYGALAARPRPDLLALVHRPQPARWSVWPLGEARIPPGAWVAVPPAPGGWTFAHLELPLTLSGRLATSLLRLPAVEAEVAFGDGSTARYRLVPATAAGGLLVGPTAETLDDLEALFRGGPAGRQAVRLRLVGPGAAYVSREARAAFRSWSLR